MKYPLILRINHAMLAAGVVIQLLLGLVMDEDGPGADGILGRVGMELHEIVGMVVLAALLLRWALFPLGYVPYGVGHYFPWFSKARMRDVFRDLTAGLGLAWRDPSKQAHLGGAIQGLLLLLATVLALSGAAMFFSPAKAGASPALVDVFKEIHEATGSIIWFFLVLHLTATVAYLAAGHRAVLSMFKFTGE